MEKLVYLVPPAARDLVERKLVPQLTQLAEHTRGLTVLTPAATASVQSSTFSAALFLWLACVDRRLAFEQALGQLELGADGYLLTESLIHGAGVRAASCDHATLLSIQQAPQLGQAEFRTRMSALTPTLRRNALAVQITRDGVVRPLVSHAPPLRALFTFVHAEQVAPLALGDAVDPLHSTYTLTSCVRRVVRPLH